LDSLHTTRRSTDPRCTPRLGSTRVLGHAVEGVHSVSFSSLLKEKKSAQLQEFCKSYMQQLKRTSRDNNGVWTRSQPCKQSLTCLTVMMACGGTGWRRNTPWGSRHSLGSVGWGCGRCRGERRAHVRWASWGGVRLLLGRSRWCNSHSAVRASQHVGCWAVAQWQSSAKAASSSMM
jgi:hypothetical protein